jgi:heme/copper-type cytochrome/quinol oxidase subunit 4
MQSSTMAWDFTVVVITVLVFAMVLAGSYWLWTS